MKIIQRIRNGMLKNKTMNTELYKPLDIEATKRKGFDIFIYWSLSDILTEINRDRSENWTNYNKSDWQEGWNEWCEGDYYKLLL